jgi:metal-dependent amidase/aminoacylase/carboxypeptidase family protein
MESGSRWNIIAEYGSLEGTTRYYKTEYTEKFKEAIERVATQTAAAYRAEATVNYIHLIPPTVNEDSFTDMAIKAAKTALGEDCLFHLPAVTGGEDFSRFLEQKPGAIAFMGVRNEAKGACWAQHHCKYNVDEDALINSVKMYVQVAMDFNAGK